MLDYKRVGQFVVQNLFQNAAIVICCMNMFITLNYNMDYCGRERIGQYINPANVVYPQELKCYPKLSHFVQMSVAKL